MDDLAEDEVDGGGPDKRFGIAVVGGDVVGDGLPADLDLHLVLDNYAAHKAPAVRRWLARPPPASTCTSSPSTAPGTPNDLGMKQASRGRVSRRFLARPASLGSVFAVCGHSAAAAGVIPAPFSAASRAAVWPCARDSSQRRRIGLEHACDGRRGSGSCGSSRWSQSSRRFLRYACAACG